MATPIWRSFPCKIAELRLDRTLACGQSFRWKEHSPGIWTGVIGCAVWQFKQTDSHLWYRVHKDVGHSKITNIKMEADSNGVIENKTPVKSVKRKSGKRHGGTQNVETVKIKEELTCGIKEEVTSDIKTTNDRLDSVKDKFSNSSNDDERVLIDYFQLHVQLEDLYKEWAKVDKHFETISKDFSGIRMLRQNPVECLFSFICSSNNHISRISSMVEKLALHFGDQINLPYCVEGREFYTFPKVSALAADGVEEKLRDLGFGYRAKYIQKSACYIVDNGDENWLFKLKDMEYIEAKTHLMKLCGVGAKVADCVLLMCLDQPGSIPVDTHVWQIAARDYIPKLNHAKSLTDKLYNEIGDYFRELWGPYAGWAHSVLFTADLRQFRNNELSNDKKGAKRKKYNSEESDVKVKVKAKKKKSL
ncbi:8-oxoguanine glycosylase ogg1 [Mactra antiquata]